ncbi:MAG: HypC/HybG/HupF family hydrogenase formation chaperone [Blastocatellia bacterium]
MCLAVPGKIVSVNAVQPPLNDLMRLGRVNFGGIVKEVNLAFVPEAQVGDFVIVHVGFAISIVDELEAAQVFEYLKAMGAMDELKEVCAN